MSNPCAYCSKLTIESLVEIARRDPMLGQSYYKHHNSFGDLEAAALAGCDLCRLALECFLQRTLYEKAKSLERSDVKLWIELYDGGSVSRQPYVLHTIAFKVGETSFEDPDGFAEVEVGLIAQEDCIHQLGPSWVGYTVEDQLLNSASNFATVNRWLRRCERGHPGCWPSETPMLPTRVIDVGTLPADAQSDQVHIFCSKGARANYIALSHCWGGDIELVLETGNLNKFQNSIPCSSLAATFRDAITITRNLGIRYLWIDSLCIIQDSRDDWEQESNNMGPIFRDSTLALFAAASKSSNDGIFNKELSVLHPKDAQIKVFSDPKDDATVMASVRCLSPVETLRRMWWESPLAARGWTFQEQVLAPRRLIYGEKGICWKCPQETFASKTSNFDAHDVLNEHRSVDPILQSPTPSCDLKIPLHSPDIISEYYRLVSSYCKRALTFPSDKLPAMSAIAEALSNRLAQQDASPRYLAGLWETDICSGLLWKATFSHAPHVSIYRAPSWSWATTDSPVTFFDLAFLNRCREWSTDLTVVSCEVCPLSPGYPFGEVKSGRLVVEGRTIPLIRSRQVVQSDFESRSRGQCQYDECLDGEDPYDSELSIYSVMKGEQRYLLTFSEKTKNLSGVDFRRGELEIDEASYREEEYKAVIICIGDTDFRGWKEVKGILVKRRPGSEEYERVGYLSKFLIECTWLDSIRRERLVIV